ncbi:MAG: cytochrome d ubiquinol oxidase subunit II [Gemmatimonadetes bacterium]|nr:cytochrome d ubiquinol oxidase subunit II [Gemmatimonadota bacterium]
MATVWFWLVAALLTMYVVLDGFDLGAGAIYPMVTRTDGERRAVLKSIGPVWDANEVWLLTAGGSLVLAFPKLYASSFSGFYLPLMAVLWLLILRAIGLEFRNHLQDRVWRPFWDAVFFGASLLLAVFLGAALGNVVRGVPLDANGYFFSPLWTNFTTQGARMGILDWFTVTVGVTSLLALAHHGALWVALKTHDPVRARATKAAAWIWPLLVLAVVVVTVFTFRIQPHVPERLREHPLGYVFPVIAVAGLLASFWLRRRAKELGAFLGSVAFLVGMLLSVSFGLYPLVLPATNDPAASLTVSNAMGPAHGMAVAFWWWIPGMILVTAYTVFIYRGMRGKVSVEGEGY